MIEFLTLFLGLTLGPQTVTLAVDEHAASVEVLLDGETVATDDAPPWEVEVDFGTELRPRLLEAVAYGAGGRPLGRSVQRINVPRPPAEATLWIETDGSGRPEAARLDWESSVRSGPLSVEAWLDGEDIPVEGVGRIALPVLEAGESHLLQAELSFSHDVKAQAQVLFGGAYAETVETELTALPIVLGRRGRASGPREMEGWFRKDRAALRVAAVESGRSDLIVVRGPGVRKAMTGLVGTIDRGVGGGIGSPGAMEGAAGVGRAMQVSSATVAERLRRAMPLERGQRLRLLLPHARRQAGRYLAMEAFAISPEITPEMGGLYWVLHQEVKLPGMSSRLRIADAVAVAGLQAAGGNRRRAVLLVLGDEAGGAGRDESRFEAAAVRGYLESLAVPLYVWHLVSEDGRPGRRPDWGPQWGEGERIGSFQALQRAARRLRKALEDQRIVWLEGRHLVHRIELAPDARADPVVGGSG